MHIRVTPPRWVEIVACKPVRNVMPCILTQKPDNVYVVICTHDDVIKWGHFPRYWPFVRGIPRSPVNSPHKGQWRGALMFWVNNRKAGDLRRNRAHYDVNVMNHFEILRTSRRLYCRALCKISLWFYSRDVCAMSWWVPRRTNFPRFRFMMILPCLNYQKHRWIGYGWIQCHDLLTIINKFHQTSFYIHYQTTDNINHSLIYCDLVSIMTYVLIYMRQASINLVHIMACRLFGTRPSSWSVVMCSYLDT